MVFTILYDLGGFEQIVLRCHAANLAIICVLFVMLIFIGIEILKVGRDKKNLVSCHKTNATQEFIMERRDADRMFNFMIFGTTLIWLSACFGCIIQIIILFK